MLVGDVEASVAQQRRSGSPNDISRIGLWIRYGQVFVEAVICGSCCQGCRQAAEMHLMGRERFEAELWPIESSSSKFLSIRARASKHQQPDLSIASYNSG